MSGRDSQITKWISSTNTSVKVMSGEFVCYRIFIDINNVLFCSLTEHHQVVKVQLDDKEQKVEVAAGTYGGSYSDQLFEPFGIFVDTNQDLYVADRGNSRIQLFPPDESDGITVAGQTSLSITIELFRPREILVDDEKYLFIVDTYFHRIVGSGPNGFRCLIGCYGKGFQSDQLSFPSSLSFDSHGNMFVLDEGNERIQKFDFLKNSCGKLIG